MVFRNKKDGKEKDDPQAFSGADYNRLQSAVDSLAHTQLGHLYDDLTAEELTQLFVPEIYRHSLSQTYSLEHDSKATGEIFVDLMRILPHQISLFEPDRRASCIPTKLTLRIQFNRNNMPDGFVTPSPVFGSALSPVTSLRGIPKGDLEHKFREGAQLLATFSGMWGVVKWVLGRLQVSLRTPGQVRYVWPAIYTLATVAKLNIAEELASPSARSGNNAIVPPDVLPYLKASYEVVAHSINLGVDGNAANRYRMGQQRMLVGVFELHDGQRNFDISGM